jgi:hypothetical protein
MEETYVSEWEKSARAGTEWNLTDLVLKILLE